MMASPTVLAVLVLAFLVGFAAGVWFAMQAAAHAAYQIADAACLRYEKRIAHTLREFIDSRSVQTASETMDEAAKRGSRKTP